MEVDGLEGLAKRLEEMWKEGEKWARVSVEDIMKAEHIIRMTMRKTQLRKSDQGRSSA
jgi:hypothetical protein